jgi:hypothetical protein|tara:strand:+ start:761 stop:1108 length:348 start_codon:yes stop_codon:yes gene_type:complete
MIKKILFQCINLEGVIDKALFDNITDQITLLLGFDFKEQMHNPFDSIFIYQVINKTTQKTAGLFMYNIIDKVLYVDINLDIKNTCIDINNCVDILGRNVPCSNVFTKVLELQISY